MRSSLNIQKILWQRINLKKLNSKNENWSDIENKYKTCLSWQKLPTAKWSCFHPYRNKIDNQRFWCLLFNSGCQANLSIKQMASSWLAPRRYMSEGCLSKFAKKSYFFKIKDVQNQRCIIHYLLLLTSCLRPIQRHQMRTTAIHHCII